MRIGKVQYNGVSSDTLGVFVSGSGSYDAAEYDVTNYQVMGRNGDILIPNNRYKNIEVTYPCFIPSDFESRVQAVRNWMRSARSYARIEDNYDLLHYRMGIGKGVLKFSPAQQSIGANAQLVFNCKPQRFLKSGEEEQDVVRTPYSFTGDTVEFETDEVKTLEKAEVTLAPSQDGTPWISTTPDTEPYLYRALPSNVGNSELDTIVGGTIAWNQLAKTSGLSTSLSNGITFTPSADGISLSGTASALASYDINVINYTTGHVYMWTGIPSGASASGYYLYVFASGRYADGITKVTGSSDWFTLRIRVASGAVINTPVVFKPKFFDLTAMFGSSIADYVYTLESGTAGAGVAWLKKYGFLTKDYYAYDAGSLLSVKTSAKVITGKNILGDEAFANSIKAALSSSTLDTTAKTIKFNGSTNGTYDIRLESLPFKENTQYTLIYSYTGNNKNLRWKYTDGTYDSSSNVTDGAYVSAQGKTVKGLYKVNNTNTNVVLSYESCGIFEGVLTASDFEAYNPTTYALDSDLELRGPLSLDANNNLVYDGDVYPPSGNVRRKFNILDLGSLTYSKSSSITNGFVATAGMPDDFPLAPSSSSMPNWVCTYAIYTNVGIEDASVDKAIAWRVSGQNKGVIIKDSTYSSYYTGNNMASFKTAMSGKYLVYEKTAPTTETADPYTSPQSVSDGGTEEYVDSRTVPMPVGHRTYYANIVPITGETGANLTHTGVNLLGGTDLKDAVVAYIPTASVDTTNKYVSFASGSATSGGSLTEGVPFKENTRYTFILSLYKSSGTGSNLRLYYTDNSYDDISVSAAQTKETVVVVSDENKTVASLRKRNSSGTTRLYYEESGIFEGVLTASQFTEYQGTTYNVTFTDQGTVYGGTYDFVTGTLKVTHANIASYNGETIGTPWLSSYEEYSVGATPTTGAQVVYPLDSPQIFSLTPQAISSIVGTNYVWSDCPPVTVGYSDPFDAHNPTQYEAKPLLKLENPLTGAVINVNAFTITATTSYTGVVEIDCESQNIYSGDTNLNSIFTVSNFPVLGEGKNVITFSDADSLKIVPRWWEL